MKELSLHILDIVENSIRANARLIEIDIDEIKTDDRLTIRIRDDGDGMDPDTLERVMDPFFTTKTVRRIGIGLSLLDQAARRTGGGISIDSSPGKGTLIRADFVYNHIDRQPIGNLVSTLTVLISGNPAIDFVLTHRINEEVFVLDTRVLREALGDVELTEPDVLDFIAGLVRERRNLSADDE